MYKFTVTMQHVAHDDIKETMTVYAPNVDSAYDVAHRAAGQWYRIVALWSKTYKN